MEFFSQRILLELTNVGFTREECIQNCSKKCNECLEKNSSFYNNIISDKKITDKIPVNKIKKII